MSHPLNEVPGMQYAPKTIAPTWALTQQYNLTNAVSQAFQQPVNTLEMGGVMYVLLDRRIAKEVDTLASKSREGLATLKEIVDQLPTYEDIVASLVKVKDALGNEFAKSIIREMGGVKMADIPPHKYAATVARCAQILTTEETAHTISRSAHEAAIGDLNTRIEQQSASNMRLTREKCEAHLELEDIKVALAAVLSVIGGPSSENMVDDAKAAIHRVKHMNVNAEALRNQILNDRDAITAGGITDVMRTMVLAELRERLALPGDDEGRIGPDETLDDLIAVRNAAPTKTYDECPTNATPEYTGTDPQQGAADIRYAPMDDVTVSLTQGQIDSLEDCSGGAFRPKHEEGRMWAQWEAGNQVLHWYVSIERAEGTEWETKKRIINLVAEDDII